MFGAWIELMCESTKSSELFALKWFNFVMWSLEIQLKKVPGKKPTNQTPLTSAQGPGQFLKQAHVTWGRGGLSQICSMKTWRLCV